MIIASRQNILILIFEIFSFATISRFKQNSNGQLIGDLTRSLRAPGIKFIFLWRHF